MFWTSYCLHLLCVGTSYCLHLLCVGTSYCLHLLCVGTSYCLHLLCVGTSYCLHLLCLGRLIVYKGFYLVWKANNLITVMYWQWAWVMTVYRQGVIPDDFNWWKPLVANMYGCACMYVDCLHNYDHTSIIWWWLGSFTELFCHHCQVIVRSLQY